MQPYLLLDADARIGQYFHKLYLHFEADIQAFYKDTPAAADYNTLYHKASQLYFDSEGRFVLRHINSKENLPAAILLYIAGAHLLVEHSDKTDLQRLFGYYRLKLAAQYRWGNTLSPLFEYIGTLLQYAKRLLRYKPLVSYQLFHNRLIFLNDSEPTNP